MSATAATDLLRRARDARAAGQREHAQQLLERLVARQSQHRKALAALGMLRMERGDAAGALSALAKAAQLDPTDRDVVTRLADAAEAAGQADKALRLLARLVDQDPTDPHRRAALGQLQLARGRAPEAAATLQRAATLAPRSARIHRTLGAALSHLDRHRESYEAYARALELRPDHAGVHTSIANVLESLGCPNEARVHRERAVALAPADPHVAWQAKSHKRYQADDPQIHALEAALEQEWLPAASQPLARLALAKMHDDAGDVAAAAAHARAAKVQRAEELARRDLAYDPTANEQRAAHTARLGADALVARHEDTAAPSAPRNILIAGLPRAGKSLLEHRLARHPLVAAGNERRYPADLQRLAADRVGTGYPACLPELADRDIAALREELAARVNATVAEVVGEPLPVEGALCNTLPANDELVALVALLDPRTVLVSVERDPRDVLLANFLQWFPNNQPFAATVSGLVHRYDVSLRLIEVWERWLPGPVVRVRYEDLTATPDEPVAQVLEACGLPWDDACADVPDASGQVTASPMDKPDLGQPVHRTFVGMWQRWAEHLPELFDAIDAAGLVERHQQRTPGRVRTAAPVAAG